MISHDLVTGEIDITLCYNNDIALRYFEVVCDNMRIQLLNKELMYN